MWRMLRPVEPFPFHSRLLSRAPQETCGGEVLTSARYPPSSTSMQRLGAHLLHVERDFMSLQWNREFYPDDLRDFLEAVDGVLREHGQAFVLVDSTRAGKLQAEARKHVVAWRSPKG